jgi:hypothetical protein
MSHKRKIRNFTIVVVALVSWLELLATPAQAVVKSKPGENEYAWRQSLGDDCEKESEGDQDNILSSACFLGSEATIVYRFRIPRRARLRGFGVDYTDAYAGCVNESWWARRPRRRIVKVFFEHGSDTDGNRYQCDIWTVWIRYRKPG